MKKTLVLALALVAGVVLNDASAAGKKRKEKPVVKADSTVVELKTAADSLSYASGMVRTRGLMPFLQKNYNVDETYIADVVRGYEDAMANGVDARETAYLAGKQVARMVADNILPFLKDEFAGRADSINDAVFHKGFADALQKGQSLMPDSVAEAYFNRAFRQAVDDRNKANKTAGEVFLADNKRKEGVVTLPSGLQYKVLVKGTGDVPGPDDEVTVKYEGRLVDGTVFDSSYKRPGETSTFRPNQVIKGWSEALTMMPVGSKWELYIPYNLAYGERRAGMIEPYSALVFTVETVGVKKAKAGAEANARGKRVKAEVAKAGARGKHIKAEATKAGARGSRVKAEAGTGK